jgi:hypothetical protein
MRPLATLDIECFHNWFLVGITDFATGIEWDFQLMDGYPLDTASIVTLLNHYTIVTFNGTGYDWPILMLALQGVDNATLKQVNDDIIVRKHKWWDVYKKYRCWPADTFDHIDVSEVAPGVKVSLKQYMCRMAYETVQDTPVDFNLPLPINHIVDEIMYCRNDRGGTKRLYEICEERIQMRARLSEKFGVDLRSKSDAQAAEAMVKAEWSRRMRESIDRMEREPPTKPFPIETFPHLQVRNYDVDYHGQPKPIVPHYPHGTTFKARIPDYIQFVTPQMQSLLQLVRDCDFVISNKDEAELMGLDGVGIRTGVLIPEQLKGLDITIGATTYRMGIGGLHSQESSASYRSIPGVQTLRTADVSSYYPSLIINAGIYPPQLGPLFLSIFETIYKDRLSAKAALKKLPKDVQEYLEVKAVEGGFKIVLNGTFGKLFSRFSIFYYPEGGIAVTIGGQLSLLMLIERLELSGIKVISANTDGIEMLIPWGYESITDSIMAWWQSATRLTMEQENYLALYSRDVNNYYRLGFDGSVKRKGAYAKSGVLENKHPDLDVCSDAVEAYLTKGTPLRDTIVACNDIRKFVRVRGAKGGAVWFRPDCEDDAIQVWADGSKHLLGGVPLGRAVRWYYARDCNDYIVDGQSFNKVAGSDGARPIMRLPSTLPDDIDYAKYVSVAEEILNDIGA